VSGRCHPKQMQRWFFCKPRHHQNQRSLRVRHHHPARVLDRTPIGLGAGSDFSYVADQAVGVRAVGAVEFFQGVEIRQMVAVEHQVIGAPHLYQTVGGKADCLIQRHANVQQDKGDDQRVDERCSQYHERDCVDDVAVEAGARLLVEAFKLRIENRSTTFQAKPQANAAFGDFGIEFNLQCLDRRRKACRFCAHDADPVSATRAAVL
jgi:hypothetical protein